MEYNIISLVFEFNSLSPCINIQIHTFRISKEYKKLSKGQTFFPYCDQFINSYNLYIDCVFIVRRKLMLVTLTKTCQVSLL